MTTNQLYLAQRCVMVGSCVLGSVDQAGKFRWADGAPASGDRFIEVVGRLLPDALDADGHLQANSEEAWELVLGALNAQKDDWVDVIFPPGMSDGRYSWVDRLQDVYAGLDEFLRLDRIYNLSERLGAEDAEKLWHENPAVGGSADPSAYGRVCPHVNVRTRPMPKGTWCGVVPVWDGSLGVCYGGVDKLDVWWADTSRVVLSIEDGSPAWRLFDSAFRPFYQDVTRPGDGLVEARVRTADARFFLAAHALRWEHDGKEFRSPRKKYPLPWDPQALLAGGASPVERAAVISAYPVSQARRDLCAEFNCMFDRTLYV